jgi:transcriptional regulator with PAS, ATPase and Fis domain
MAKIVLFDWPEDKRLQTTRWLEQLNHQVLATTRDPSEIPVSPDEVYVVIQNPQVADAVHHRALGELSSQWPHTRFVGFSYVPHDRAPSEFVEPHWPLDDNALLALLRCVDSHKHAIRSHVVIAESDAMKSIVKWLDRVARSSLPVILSGETGTGKEVLARELHLRSERRLRQLVPVNCGALPDSLFEAEIFGFVKGAFTGADRDRAGLAEAADGGTLFLDEVGELSASSQVRLLRFLESGEVRRVGSSKVQRIDVRVVSATNHSLREAVERAQFRSDLYFRLGAECWIPPLRQRPEDLLALVHLWLLQNGTGASAITGEALSRLLKHSWPGNARELRTVLQHAQALADNRPITLNEVEAALLPVPAVTEPLDYESSERVELEEALQRHQWKLGATAKSLGISRTTLWRKLRRHDQ